MVSGPEDEYTVVKSVCIASGECVVHAPALFRQDKQGLAEMIRPAETEEERGLAREAYEDCPSGAIRLAGAPTDG